MTPEHQKEIELRWKSYNGRLDSRPVYGVLMQAVRDINELLEVLDEFFRARAQARKRDEEEVS